MSSLDYIDECINRRESMCDNGTTANYVSSRYDNASAALIVFCAILMFFMKAGFLFVEESFCESNRVSIRRRVVLAKYIDIFSGTFGFWLFGFAISANNGNVHVLEEDQDFLFWFFRFTFASNTATILGGTLVGHSVQMRTTAICVYSFVMTAFIHPFLARVFWSTGLDDTNLRWSPFAYCNGTFMADHVHEFTTLTDTTHFGNYMFIDFAGSGLVHLCGGIGGLVLAIFHKLEIARKAHKLRTCCTRRLLRDTSDETVAVISGVDPREAPEIPKGFIEWMYPSGGGRENVEFSALGIIILWTTWFAFNAGSTEMISGKMMHNAVGRIALVMCLACASAGLIQVLVSGLVQIYKRDETFNTNEIANVVLGALVAVTGCCPFIEPWFALIIGSVTVIVYHLGCWIEYFLKLHDGAKIFPVHGMCGFWGVLCVGLFSRSCHIRQLYENLCFCESSVFPDNIVSAIEDRGYLFAYQLAGGLFITVWSTVLCTIVFLTLWIFPVKLILTCLPWVCCFKDERRGEIEFTGNVLFTHFDEIRGPNNAIDLDEDL